MTETAVETYDTTTRGAASMAAYRAVRILQLLSENTGEIGRASCRARA